MRSAHGLMSALLKVRREREMTTHKKAAEQERPIRNAQVKQFKAHYKAPKQAKRGAQL